MEPVKYFGGLEGGATHSNLVICDNTGAVLGTAKGPGTNHWTLGIEECVNRVLKMLHDAKDAAGISRDMPLDSLCLAMSGCEQESTNAELAHRVKEKDATCAHALYVASDTAGSLFTGAPDGGIVLIAGTGSNALIRTASGQQFGCGGWGHLIGDEGGAYWISHRAVKTVFDDVDGLKCTSHPTDRVWDAIREHFQVDTRADLLSHVYANFDKSFYAGLTQKIAQLASTDDSLSRQLFIDAGCALADHIIALSKRADFDKIRVVCVGSVWKSWDFMKPGMVERLKSRNMQHELDFVTLRVSSAMGAAYLAAKNIDYELPHDDSIYCEVFYSYNPEDHEVINENGIENYPSEVNGKDLYLTEGVNGKEIFGLNGLVNGKLNGNSFENGIGNGDWVKRS